ncbi:MAG: phosphoribosylanthranilate isomerase, partial [Pseudomonadota bacterium]
DSSPRSVSVEAATSIIKSSTIPVVLLFEKSCEEIKKIALHAKPYGVQLVGESQPGEIELLRQDTGCAVWKTLHLPKDHSGGLAFDDTLVSANLFAAAGVDIIVLDTLLKNKRGGTGEVCDWKTAHKIACACRAPVFLAGGITPANVQDAVARVNPYGVDLSSGVEELPGKKDPEKIALLMERIRSVECSRGDKLTR